MNAYACTYVHAPPRSRKARQGKKKRTLCKMQKEMRKGRLRKSFKVEKPTAPSPLSSLPRQKKDAMQPMHNKKTAKKSRRTTSESPSFIHSRKKDVSMGYLRSIYEQRCLYEVHGHGQVNPKETCTVRITLQKMPPTTLLYGCMHAHLTIYASSTHSHFSKNTRGGATSPAIKEKKGVSAKDSAR